MCAMLLASSSCSAPKWQIRQLCLTGMCVCVCLCVCVGSRGCKLKRTGQKTSIKLGVITLYSLTPDNSVQYGCVL